MFITERKKKLSFSAMKHIHVNKIIIFQQFMLQISVQTTNYGLGDHDFLSLQS